MSGVLPADLRAAAVLGGDMGRRLQAYDWAGHPLGHPAGWPAAVRGQVATALASRFPIVLWLGEPLYLIYNDAYIPMLGDKHPAALGRAGAEVWWDIWDVVGPMLGSVMSTGVATWSDDLMLLLVNDGRRQERYFTFTYSPILGPGGQVEGVFCAVAETTERVLGERRLQTLTTLAAALGDVQDPDAVLDAAVQVCAAHDADVRFAAVYRTTGPSGQARVHRVTPDAAGLLPDSLAPWLDGVSGNEGGTYLAGDLPARIAGLRARFGDRCPEQALVIPVSEAAGDQPGAVLVLGLNCCRPLDDLYRGFCRLLADQVSSALAGARAYEGERRRAEALAELDQAKTAFFSNISHEFRTPLTLIMGPVAELRRQLASAGPLVREELEVVHRNGLRLGRLVNTLLDFSRIQAGRMQASHEPADLAGVTAELASVFRSAIDRAGLAFEVDCPPLPGPVYLDVGMWEKVMLNLLSNALKFTFEGSIRVAVRAQDGQAVITVADTGTGVPAQQMPRLFERFHRIPSARARSNEGSGIGLALVRELVQLHGGTITADSIEGKGTTFTIRLPFGHAHLPAGSIVPDRQAAVATAVAATADPFITEALRWLPRDGGEGTGPELPAPAGQALPARVLVADDNADMREYLARLLHTTGYQITTAADGQAALDAVRATAPDLVLADVMMPRLDGLGLVAALRADPRTALVPVVFLSARAGEEAAAAGLAAGADDYLPKPFSTAELLARVRSNLDMARFRSRESAFRRALIDSMQEGFFVTDSRGTMLEANKAFLDLVGYSPAGLPYRWPHPWVPSPQADPEGYAKYRRPDGEGYTVPMRHRDGHTVWLTCSSASLPGHDGSGTVFVGTARDVTAQRLAAQREATLASFATALATATTASSLLAIAARAIGEALPASQVIIAMWPATAPPAIISWPPLPRGQQPSADVNDALAATRHQPAASATIMPGQAGASLLAAPLDGAGTTAIVTVLPAARPAPAGDRELYAVLTSHLAQVLAKTRDYEQARTVALTLQQAILGPTHLPHGFAARYTPAVEPLQVGGDWYDVVPLPSQRIGIVVGDCVGRGLPAAAIMGQLRSASQAVLLRAPDPAGALADLDTFARRIPGAECTSVFCAIIDPAAATVTYSSAGHPPPILATPGGATSLLDQAQSLPLAIDPALSSRRQATATLAPGATLLLYTDGLAERRHIPLDDGISAAAGLLTRHGRRHPSDLADQIMSAMTPPAGFEDDVAMLIYRHPPAPLNVHVSTADSTLLATIRAELRQWLPAAGIGQPEGADILVAIGEAAANAMEHAPAGHPGPVHIAVTVSMTCTTMTATIADTGSWRPPHAQPDGRGNGIAVMRALMDEVTIDTASHGTTITLIKELAGPCQDTPPPQIPPAPSHSPASTSPPPPASTPPPCTPPGTST